MSGHGKNILLSPDHLMQPRTNYFFFLSTQWFSPKNLSILIKYWNIFSFPARVSELASKHESQQEESPLRLPVLRPWSQRHDPLLPHLPPPDGLQVLLHQRLIRPPFCRWERQGSRRCSLSPDYSRVRPVNIDWDVPAGGRAGKWGREGGMLLSA